MSETIQSAAPAPAEPIVVTPTGAPPVEAAAPAPAPAADPAPAAPENVPTNEGQSAPEAPVEAAKPKSLLESVDELPKEGLAEAVPAEPAAPPPLTVYEAFTLPEGVQADEGQLNAYREIAGKHGLDQATAQNLLNMHTGTLKQYGERLVQEQHRVFGETKAAWAEQARTDPDYGMGSFETSLRAAARARDLLVPEERREAFNTMLANTGVGDHPEFLRLLVNMARHTDEPAAPNPATRPAPGGGAPKRDFISSMYTHPSSQRMMNGGGR